MKDWFNNHRKETGWLTAALVIMVVALTASGGGNQPASLSAQSSAAVSDDQLADWQAQAQALADDIAAARSTTTGPTTTGSTSTRPSTTTTTRPGATTTTPPTTTTQPPTTTTTFPTPSGERFVTMLRGDGDFSGEFWWDANYFRMLPSGTGWTDGDRSGYRCFYAFLIADGDDQSSEVLGRVTFARINEAAGYASINDRYMQEGIRFYDGTLDIPDTGRELGECNLGREEIAYEPSSGPWQLPTITYETNDGEVLEVRNYKPLVTGAGITFRQTSADDNLITVIAYRFGSPAIAIYYESLSDSVVMNSDFDDPTAG